jgi:hypothetical protein
MVEANHSLQQAAIRTMLEHGCDNAGAPGCRESLQAGAQAPKAKTAVHGEARPRCPGEGVSRLASRADRRAKLIVEQWFMGCGRDFFFSAFRLSLIGD